jgi:hypothetical protein
MGKILEFPSQQAHGLAYLDRQLRQLLASRGADQALIDFAAQQLTTTYSRYIQSEPCSLTLHLPGELSDAQREALEQQLTEELEAVHRDSHARALELVAELVLAEIRLFQQGRS